MRYATFCVPYIFLYLAYVDFYELSIAFLGVTHICIIKQIIEDIIATAICQIIYSLVPNMYDKNKLQKVKKLKKLTFIFWSLTILTIVTINELINIKGNKLSKIIISKKIQLGA